MLSALKPSKIPLVILVLTLGALSLGIAEFTTVWLLPNIAADLNLQIEKVGSAASFYALGVLFGSPILALLGLRLPSVRFFTLLLFWCMLGNIATSYVSSWEQLYWVRFLCGIPHGVFLALAASVVTQILPFHQQGRAMGFILAGIGVALLIIVPLTSLFSFSQDWRNIFRVVALMDLLIILLLHDLLPEFSANQTTSKRSQLRVLKKPLLWWILCIAATAICGRMAIFAYAEPIVTNISQLSSSKFPLIIICGGIGTVLGFLLGGYFADINPNKTIGYALIWFVVAILLFQYLVQHPTWVYAAFVMLGSFTLVVAPLQLLSLRYAPEGRTFAACLIHSALNLANATGPILAAMMIGAGFGWLSLTWLTLGMVLLALLIFVIGMLLLRNTQMPAANSSSS